MICSDFIEHNETVDRLIHTLPTVYIIYIYYSICINEDTRKATGNVLTQRERGNTNLSEGRSPFKFI